MEKRKSNGFIGTFRWATNVIIKLAGDASPQKDAGSCEHLWWGHLRLQGDGRRRDFV